MTTFEANVEALLADLDLGTPSARKRGSNPDFPYVPVIEWEGDAGQPHATNPARGLAFATRDEAVNCASRHIDRFRRDLQRKLSEPRYRALREQHGLPRELPTELEN